jgi:hypothetical protein
MPHTLPAASRTLLRLLVLHMNGTMPVCIVHAELCLFVLHMTEPRLFLLCRAKEEPGA